MARAWMEDIMAGMATRYLGPRNRILEQAGVDPGSYDEIRWIARRWAERREE
jgi:hypothetical protein